MKKFISICALAAVCALPASAQYVGTVRVKETSVRAEADSVRVSFKVEVDREGSRWSQGIMLTPALTDGDPEMAETNITALPSLMLQGRNKGRTYDRGITLAGRKKRAEFNYPEITLRTTDATDSLLCYDFAVPYEAWMDNAALSLYEEIVDFRNERRLLVLSMGEGIEKAAPVAEPVIVQPIETVEPAVPAVPAAPKKCILEGEAFIDFPVGGTRILPDFRDNASELERLKDVLCSVQNTPGVTVEGLAIEGRASVEGPYANNERLANLRSLALRDYIIDNFDLPLNNKISVSWVAEDWDGLAALVDGSDIEQKDEILDIIETVRIFDGRESKLMRVDGGEPYRIMLQDMFPQLRRVKYRIEYTVQE